MSKAEKLLRELIALPSVNPAFLPANHPRAGEQRIGEFLAATAATGGLDVEFRAVSAGRSNLLAVLSPRSKRRQRILLAPHLDTVNGEEHQFTPVKKQARIYGRGACDAKGSISAMLCALLELAAGKDRPSETEIVLAGLVDEEFAQTGSREFGRSGFKADLAIIGEPTRQQVVTAHKGTLWAHLETRGKSAHGSRPELGRNAVHEMARIVNWVETDYAGRLRRRRHSILGTPTVNVGLIRGGTQANIVPDQCQILIDRRTLPGETETGIMREIRTMLKAGGMNAMISNGKFGGGLPMETDPGLPLVRQFLASARQRKPAGVNYFCDASILSQAGSPSVVFGPGDIAHAHTSDEWIDVDSLERATEILLKFLRSLP
jgi:succinyl-diaminopimelate desuccinylase